MKYFIYFIAILIVLAVNMELARILITTPIRLNLLLLLVVFSALEKKDTSSLFLAFMSGLFLDFYGSASFGSFLLSLIIIASVLNWATKTFLIHELNWRLVVLFLAIAFLASEILVRVFTLILPRDGFLSPALDFRQIWLGLFYGAIFHLLAALPIYIFWQYVLKIVGRLESKSVMLK